MVRCIRDWPVNLTLKYIQAMLMKGNNGMVLKQETQESANVTDFGIKEHFWKVVYRHEVGL